MRKPKLDIRYKRDVSTCSICGGEMERQCGFMLVNKKTLESVCEKTCGKLYAPWLVEDLEKITCCPVKGEKEDLEMRN